MRDFILLPRRCRRLAGGAAALGRPGHRRQRRRPRTRRRRLPLVQPDPGRAAARQAARPGGAAARRWTRCCAWRPPAPATACRSPCAAAAPATTASACRCTAASSMDATGAEPGAAHRARLGLRAGRRADARPQPGGARAPASSCACGPAPSASPRVGGFIAGGHSGIGSIRHGILADPGNVRRLRIVTLRRPAAGARPARCRHPEGAPCLRQQRHHHRGRDRADRRGGVAAHASRCSTATTRCCASAWRSGSAASTAHRRVPALARWSAASRPTTPACASRLEDADAMFAQVSPATLPAYEALAQAHGRPRGGARHRGRTAGARPAVGHRMRLQPHHAGGAEVRPRRHLPAGGLPGAAGCRRWWRSRCSASATRSVMHHEFSRPAASWWPLRCRWCSTSTKPSCAS